MKNIYKTNWLIGAVILSLTAVAPLWAEQAPQPASSAIASSTDEILLNFRGVPLDAVLDYLSKAAGFIIVKEANVDGRVDVWSHQPLTKDEAVELLNTVLHEKGFSAVRNDRTLTIVSRDEAHKRDIPVKTGANPELIPRTDQMVTQIIPVRYADAAQLVENIQPLIPSYATLTFNESSNALVLTDTQKNIHRMVEIIKALDTSISNISSVRVFQVQFADATELVTVINQLFQADATATGGRNNNMPPFMRMMGGGRGGDRGGRGGQSGNEETSEAKKAAVRVVAVADERTNSLVVTAPEEMMETIAMLIMQIDTTIDDITEIRVFILKYADATEMAELITELFPDDSTSQNQFAPQFGRGGMRGMMGGGRGGRSNTQQTGSERQLKQTTVQVVADPRTDSVIVSAASETMYQIEQMITQLDKNPAKRQKVFIYKLEYADVENVSEILRSIFEEQSTSRNSNTQNTNTLSNRTVNTGTTNQGQGRN